MDDDVDEIDSASDTSSDVGGSEIPVTSCTNSSGVILDGVFFWTDSTMGDALPETKLGTSDRGEDGIVA